MENFHLSSARLKPHKPVRWLPLTENICLEELKMEQEKAPDNKPKQDTESQDIDR